jgi:hypothetical protein
VSQVSPESSTPLPHLSAVGQSPNKQGRSIVPQAEKSAALITITAAKKPILLSFFMAFLLGYDLIREQPIELVGPQNLFDCPVR